MTIKKLAIIVFFFPAFAFSAENVVLASWSEHQKQGWLQHDFSGETLYLVDQKSIALKAKAVNSASSLYRNIEVDLNQTPFLQWSWRAEYFDGQGQEKQREGDDFVARFYAVANIGIFPWQKRALVYVVSRQYETTEFWSNPFTDNVLMVVVDSFEETKGQWRQHKVNLKEDFKHYFDIDIDSIEGVALMSDTDNAGGTAVARYGNIYFSAQ